MNELKIVVVGALAAIAIGIIFGTMSINSQNECQTRLADLQSQRAQLDARENSIGGSLDLNGELAAAGEAYNAEVQQYNAECT